MIDIEKKWMIIYVMGNILFLTICAALGGLVFAFSGNFFVGLPVGIMIGFIWGLVINPWWSQYTRDKVDKVTE